MHVVRLMGALALSLALMPGAGAQGLVNPATEATFWRIALATQGVTLPAFVAPGDLSGPVRQGQILSGGFWLLGRLLD